MKPTIASPMLPLWMTIISSLTIGQLAQAQMPTIVDLTPKATSSKSAAVVPIEVRCQDLKTVVIKGDRQATMMTWNTNYFGRDFSNSKRCQMVSERLQKAANLNGGTFQGLELGSGNVNSQPVVCTLQNVRKKCDRDNILFTLKPENANNPEAVIQQIVKFGEDGSGSIDESVRSRSKVDLNLGNWEQKVLSPNTSSTTILKGKKAGF